jgi:hypothetical protein
MNGGHSSHFDGPESSRDDDLLGALRVMGAVEHAKILAEALFLKGEAKQAEAEGEEENSFNLHEHSWELIEELDCRFYQLKPDLTEFLQKHFDAHPESFPK